MLSLCKHQNKTDSTLKTN
uniref:Uncharacterized protein n=1 Tax=Arundo donax TaxID=35708 RepID=A0A0A9C491_ARUDO